MRINLPTSIRFAIYVFTAVGQIVVTYLVAKDMIGTAETAAWTSFSALVAAMAAINTSPEGK